MAEKKPAKKGAGTGKASDAFTNEERAAMRARVREMKADKRRGPSADKADGETEVLAKIAAMPAKDRAIGERLHAIVKANAPELEPKLWYGMPAYARRDGKLICFFQDSLRFKTRYVTLGFSDNAHLDEGHLWPTAFAVTELTSAEEAKIAALLKKAVE